MQPQIGDIGRPYHRFPRRLHLYEMTGLVGVLCESGQADKQNNVLKNAPHTADMLAAENWAHPYSRAQACFPAKWLHDYKFWPPVSRIDNVYGDRNLVCSCA